MVIAFIVRVVFIDNPILWKDEVFSVYYARLDYLHHLSLYRTTDLHPPLYPVMLKFWVSLFGEGRSPMRLLSVLFGVFTLPALFLIGKEWIGLRVATLSAFLLALNPVNIHFSRELRSYAALSFFLLWATYFFLKIIKDYNNGRRSNIDLAVFSILLATTFYLHYSSFIYFVLFSVIAALNFLSDRDVRKFGFLIAGLAGATLLCAPQLVHFFGYSLHAGAARNSWMEPTTLKLFWTQTLGVYPFPSLTKLVVYPLYALGAYSLFRRSRTLFLTVAMFVVIGPLLVAAIGIFRPMYLIRTIQSFVILSPLLLAIGVDDLRALLGKRVLWIAIPLLILVHLAALRPDYPLQRQANAGEAIKEIMKGHERETVYFDRTLDGFSDVDYDPELTVFKVNKINWRPVTLGNPKVDVALISKHLKECHGSKKSCPPTTIIIWDDPRIIIPEEVVWDHALDDMARIYPKRYDQVLADYRIVRFE
jgi:hypothetical protein